MDTNDLIHPSAIISASARLGSNVEVGAFSVIGAEVEIGDNVKIHHHVVIDSHTSIGEGCEIFPFASLGLPPQHLHFKGEPSKLIIGKNNLIREQVTMHRGTAVGNMQTVIGDDNFVFVGCHIAHDCIVGNNNILGNYAGLGGHVEVGNNAYLGGYCAFHQFVRIGSNAIIGGHSTVVNDVIPFGNAFGPRATLNGLNVIGMSRQNFSKKQIMTLQKMFDGIFKSDGLFGERIAKAKAEFAGNHEAEMVLAFIEQAQGNNARGLCKPE